MHSQALRLSRICSFEKDFNRQREEKKSCYLNRVYPKLLIVTEIEKVKFPSTSNNRDIKIKGIPLINSYHPLLKD